MSTMHFGLKCTLIKSELVVGHDHLVVEISPVVHNTKHTFYSCQKWPQSMAGGCRAVCVLYREVANTTFQRLYSFFPNSAEG